MTINLDKTYCASADCAGACGRKLPDDVPHELLQRMWFGCFCGNLLNKIENIVDTCLISGYVPPFKHK